MADSLVQQWHLPDRFAYGTLAAVRVAPFMAGDWAVIGAARRLRGLQPRGPLARIREGGDRLLVMLGLGHPAGRAAGPGDGCPRVRLRGPAHALPAAPDELAGLARDRRRLRCRGSRARAAPLRKPPTGAGSLLA